MYPHLNLRSWPFQVVPEPQKCDFLADRSQLSRDLRELITTLRRRDASSIHVFWSWFGAGKTHTLFYLQNLAGAAEDGTSMVTVYSEFPKSPNSFVDVYRAFISGLDEELIGNAYLELATGAPEMVLRRIRTLAADLHSAMYVVATGTDNARMLAMRWLRADALSVAECRLIGVPRRLTTAEDAVRVFSSLILALVASQVSSSAAAFPRVLWMIDEYQRIANCPPRILRAINDGLHSAFNACPSGFSLFLSFSGRPQSKLPEWFSPELRDRIGLTKVMILPPMTRIEGMQFIRDLMSHYRMGEAIPPFFPFDEDSCLKILLWLEAKGEIKPRGIMQAFGAVLDEAEPLMARGELKVVTGEFATRVLAERVSLYEGEN